MNSADKGVVLHCLKSMIDEAVCEECPLYGMTGTDHCEKDCVRLAINALEQEPCGDAISRQAVLDLPKNTERGFGGKILEQSINIEYIKALPPVTPAEKVGRWVKTIGENGVTSAVRCSECGFEDNRYMLFRYCPNCGSYNGGAE